jgi:hypothetical protein
MVSNPLTAIGTFLVNTLQQRLKAAREQGGQELASQLGQSNPGRKLLQVSAMRHERRLLMIALIAMYWTRARRSFQARGCACRK